MNSTAERVPKHALDVLVVLKEGTRLLEPDVYRTRIDGQPVVVKDYSRYKWTPLSPIARLMVRHEVKILQRLNGWRHAPALLGTLGRLALGMAFIPGETLSTSAAVGQEVFSDLQNALRKLHSAGITHNDLHGTNVLINAGVPVLIDFTSALHFPHWLRSSAISRQLRRSDVANFQKLRLRLTGIAPSAEEAALAAEPHWLRSIRNGWKRMYRRTKKAAPH